MDHLVILDRLDRQVLRLAQVLSIIILPVEQQAMLEMEELVELEEMRVTEECLVTGMVAEALLTV